MSSDAANRLPIDHPEPRPSPAADVSFSLNNGAGSSRNGESSSRGSGDRWSEKGERLRDKLLTPERAAFGRRSEDGGSTEDGSERRKRVRRSGGGGGGGFLRESVFGNGMLKGGEGTGKKEGKRRVGENGLQIDKRRLAANRLSHDSGSHGSSPLSREVSIDYAERENHDRPPSSRPTTMDPAQLVQMALSLSESRKKQTSSSLPLPVAPPRGRHVSGGDTYGTVRSRTSGRQRLSSSNYNTPSPRHLSHTEERTPADTPELPDANVFFTFSPATLARAEKARKYFELANQHRRLLQYLPPLKPDAESSGNYTYESRSSPGYTQPEIRRVRSNTTSKYELGRQYNPLQTIRNRRLRNRERRELPVQPSRFEDTEKVEGWLDDVEDAARFPGYRSGQDEVHLPSYEEEVASAEKTSGDHNKRHKRTGTAGSIITKPENDWTVDPTEALADAYWVERGEHKTFIENRRGQRIFPGRPKKSVEMPRLSVERSGSYTDANHTADEDRTGSADEEDAERVPRKHRMTISLHKSKARRNKLSLLSRSASASSVSSSEGRHRRQRGDFESGNVGPLQRHMDAMIAKDMKGDLDTPQLVSPDHWDSKYSPFQVHRPSQQRSSAQHAKSNDTLSPVLVPEHRRSKSADGRVGQLQESEQVRSSIDSTPPLSPVTPNHVPSLGMELSPPSSKRPSPHDPKKQHMPKILPIFRSKSKDRGKPEGKDFAMPNGENDTHRSSATTIDPTRLSIDSTRPASFKRHQTNDSVASSLLRFGPQRTNTTSDGSIKDPGSAVGRFFRGNKLSDFRGRKRAKDKDGFVSDASALPSDASDTEGSISDSELGVRSANDSEASPRTSIDRARPKTRSHFSNLPTFKPAAGREKTNAPLTPVISNEDVDPIARQTAAQREVGKSPRFAKLAPPRISLPAEDGTDSDGPGQKSNGDPRRKSYGMLAPNGEQASAGSSKVSLGEPGAMGRFPMSGLSKVQARDGKRHWSISDRAMLNKALSSQEKDNRVSARDLARARALLLASGIKAHSIILRANTVPDPLPAYLTSAASTASKPTPSRTSLKDSHLTAAQLLSTHLDTTFTSLSDLQRAYSSTTSHALHHRSEDLKSLASDKLTHTVHNTSDEADAFNVRLTTEQTLRIKQVDDAVDEMLRLRRRQFRFARKVGFKVLEWMVLGLMWWVWFVVVVFKSCKRVVGWVLGIVRWLFWF